jgi:bacterioferritin-associated ferredoxin
MLPDDELCLCFHVSWRKVINFLRVHRPKKASQLSECGGAGTGCGWCRKQLERMAEAVQRNPPTGPELDAWLAENSPAKQAYTSGRQSYINSGKGKPPTEPSSNQSED